MAAIAGAVGRPAGRKAGQLTDTIYALSSGAPPAGIAVIRISGPRADVALAALAGRLPAPRMAALRRLRHRGEPIDQAIVLRFPGPGSATGEDVAELHLHGGRAVTARALAALAEMAGLRAAEPGEFTRRAFAHGRLDLAEAEGLGDLLAAETEGQRRAALLLLGGALGRQVEEWQRALLGLAAEVEAALDFSDEDDVAPLAGAFAARLAALRGALAQWLARPPAERLKDGIRVVVAGPPNAGKSSLFNALAQRDAAIVASVPGTTRDLIEAPVSLGGIAILLIDTAGLRAAADPVEAIGVARAQASVAAADIVLWLGPPAAAPPGAVRIHAKADLGPPGEAVDLETSAATGLGIEALSGLLAERATALLPPPGEAALNRRHREALGEAAAALAGDHDDLLLVAEQLRAARAALDRVTGRAGVEDMLDAVFARFCIGK